MNVYLIGYRGSGKTCVAGHLAELLQLPWADADAELERRAGRTIREIFAADGERAFRDLESAVLTDLAERGGQVIALGGGVVLREANRAVLRRSGRTVWLRAQPETLWQRIEGDPTTGDRRPNLTAHGGIEEVRRLLDARTPFYEESADLALDTEDKSPAEIAQAIAAWLATG
jgi:shikimate kinase